MPYVAAAASGLFAEHGLDVEILEPAGGPENVERVAAAGAEFCLTSVTHYLRARARSGDVGARFAAVIVRRSPMAAIVAAEGDLHQPADLAGCRLGGTAESAMVQSFQAALSEAGLAPAAVVPMSYAEAPAALGRGEIDAVADFADLMPRTRRQAGIAVRAVPFATDVYASGLVAGDSVADDVVARMRAGLVAALEEQRRDPKWGLRALLDRYPGVDPDDALEGWALVEPNVFSGAPVGSMHPDRWAATVTHLARAHGLTAPPPATVYRLQPHDETA